MERLEHLIDHGTFHELDGNLESADPLKFADTDSYVKRQAEASRKSGLTEAVITGEGEIEGEKAASASWTSDISAARWAR